MRSSLRAAAFAANAAFIFASPTNVSEPCAQVSAALAANPSTDQYGNPIVDINTAYACLKTVPLAKSSDLLQLNGYKTLANFQSDLAYLKDPPPGWLYSGVDLMSSLDGIISNVQKDAYDNEYDVQFDLWSLITSVHDFHLTFNSDILNVFSWWRAAYLVSLATNANSLPNVYDISDIYVLAGLNSSSYKPSPVVSINNTYDFPESLYHSSDTVLTHLAETWSSGSISMLHSSHGISKFPAFDPYFETTTTYDMRLRQVWIIY